MKPSIVTIGNFDGMHRGHQYMLRQVADRARALEVASFAVTFEPHPQSVLHPEHKPPKLMEPEEKARLLRAAGMDQVWVCPFTHELSLLTPRQFMGMVSDRQPIAELWIGADFALGRGRSGTVAVLSEIGSDHGWAVHVVSPYREANQVVSSTAIRALLASGEVASAARLLGRPYGLWGQLEGAGNPPREMCVSADRAIPGPGEYLARLRRRSADTEIPLVQSLDRLTEEEGWSAARVVIRPGDLPRPGDQHCRIEVGSADLPAASGSVVLQFLGRTAEPGSLSAALQ